jgi:tape measure domain-containing protein
MQDAARFVSEARAAGASVRQMGKESRYTGAAFHYLGGRGFWLNQIFFTIRRVVYGVTLALIGLSGAALKMGFDFNSAMQQNRIAMRHFLPSAEAVNAELRYMYRFEAYTPLQFKDVAFAERQFLAFGFTLHDTHRYLRDLTDAIAAHGLGADALLRVVMAFSRVQAYGKLTGRTLYQLAANNIPAYDILREKLHLTRAELANIARMNIPASVALPALAAGLEQRYSGAARAQALGTMHGLFTTFKDFLAQFTGSVELSLFMRLQHGLANINDFLGKISDTSQKTHGNLNAIFREIDKGIGHGVNLALVWQRFVGVIQPFAQIWLVLAETMLFAIHTLGIGTKVMAIFGFVLRQVASVLQFLQPVLAPLITLLIAERTALMLVTLATKTSILWDVLKVVWTKRKSQAETLYLLWLGRGTLAIRARSFWESVHLMWMMRAEFATRLITKATAIWETVTIAAMIAQEAFTGAIVASTLALLANPFTWIILGLVAIVGGLTTAYIKWRWFHNAVNGFIGKNAQDLRNFIGDIKTLIGWLIKAEHYAKTLWNFDPFSGGRDRGGHKKNDWGLVGWVGQQIVGWFQGGGTVFSPGVYGVGERGPELVHLPAGARVTPIATPEPLAIPAGFGGASEVTIRVPLLLDGRQVAEANARAQLDAMANVRGRD